VTVQILTGDCREVLATLPDASVHCVVTSPPYFGLRDYGVDGQIGLEDSHDCLGWATQQPCGVCFVCRMVGVFREVRRVLRDDGTLWLNLGDSYAGGARGGQGDKSTLDGTRRNQNESRKALKKIASRRRDDALIPRSALARHGLKQKDLMMMPARVAMVLQADGWYLRQDIIWAKPNPMPESVRDRCTKAHEYLFLLSKSPRYYFDAEAIKEVCAWDATNTKMPDGWDTCEGGHGSFHRNGREAGAKVKRPELARGFRGGSYCGSTTHDNDGDGAERKTVGNEYAPEGFKRNKRSVWTVATMPCKEAHFATFPPALIEPCILAGCPRDGTVLDPFGGAGTTGLVADRLQRDAILIELNPAYVEIAKRRINADAPLFAEVTA
jgi:DNA modification methylase